MKWPAKLIWSLVSAVGRQGRSDKEEREALVFDLYVARARAMRAEEKLRQQALAEADCGCDY